MSEVFSARPSEAVDDLAQARAGDDAAFTRLVQPPRRELHAHCYRMLGSSHDAHDALQDALLRAWRSVARFEGRSSLRSWLYTVATRTCLDTVERRGKREAVELAFVAALQHLPANQRAALLLFEVLGFSAAEIATTMQTSVTSVNSALARARKVVEEKVPARSQQQTLREIDDNRVREIVARFSAALERGDAEGLVALLTEDVTCSMPPMPHWYRGLAAVTDFAV